ncbi:Peroxisomal membrane protein pex16 [Borealophlyctis nickersoniae]|nr:Peroxisomal membrane protein pex16 [Borealophlyctis nickersoniae]
MAAFLEKYESFVLHNAPQISGIESGLRSLSYILPGRFNDADMASETIFALVNLMSIHHDAILAHAAATQQPTATPKVFNKYTRTMLKSSSAYKSVAYSLVVLKTMEVLLEMAAKKTGGEKRRWRAVMAIEAFKVIGRVTLLHLSGRRSLLHSSIPERDYDPANILPPSPNDVSATWTGKRTGREHVAVDILAQREGEGSSAGRDQAVRYLLSKALTEGTVEAKDMVPKKGVVRRSGEIIFILRPLLYVLALRKYGKDSWKPWIASLVMELSSLLTFFSLGGSVGVRQRADLTALEKEECKRRVYLFLFYFLRDPFYGMFTRSFSDRMNAFCERASKRPLISLFAGLLRDYQPLWENWYFYTAAQ